MEPTTSRMSEIAYATMRVVVAIMFMQHGAQKLFGLLGGMGSSGATAPLASLMGLAGVIEFFGGLLIAVGLFGAVVAVIASGEMAVAYFMQHAPQGPAPILNGGELAVLYAFVFLYVATRGSGPYSLDRALRRRSA